MREEECTIVSNTEVQEKYYLMKIRSEYISENCSPGNFVMIAVTGENDPLLKKAVRNIQKRDGLFLYIL